jgi:FlaG/FlaF family flagellin (archaellin)
MLKLHAGVSKKVGLPGFSSASASCTIEAELDSSLLTDTAGFQIVVQRAYQSCEQAVQDQIARLTHDGQSDASQPRVQPQEIVEVRTSPTISGARITTNGAETRETNRAVFRDAPSPRPATASQVKAIRAIAARRKIDLVGMLRERFGLTTADELGIRQASNLIDELKGDEPTTSPGTSGNGAYATTGGAR